MTANDALSTLIGRKAVVTLEKLEVQVKILDVKNAYGNDRILVEPIAGKGQMWINAKRITLI